MAGMSSPIGHQSSRGLIMGQVARRRAAEQDRQHASDLDRIVQIAAGLAAQGMDPKHIPEEAKRVYEKLVR